MSFKFKPKPTVDREATEEEIKKTKEAEEMLLVMLAVQD